MPTHAVIWLDHKEARVFHVHPESVGETTILAPKHHLHSEPDMPRFFAEATRTLQGADAVLIVGPSSAKLELFRYIHQHDHALEAKVVGIESADHPTDNRIVAHARRAFAASDRMG